MNIFVKRVDKKGQTLDTRVTFERVEKGHQANSTAYAYMLRSY